MYVLICSYVGLHLRIPQRTDLHTIMSRLLKTLGLLLGLWTFASLVSIFVDSAHITFWATGYGIGMELLLLWAPSYLFVMSRQVTDPARAHAPAIFPADLAVYCTSCCPHGLLVQRRTGDSEW